MGTGRSRDALGQAGRETGRPLRRAPAWAGGTAGWIRMRGGDPAGRGPLRLRPGRLSRLTTNGCTASYLFLESEGHVEIDVHRELR